MQRASLARLALLAMLWGSNFLWIKIALRGLSPTQIVLARLALAAAVLWAIIRARGLRLPRGARLWAHLTAAALFANAVPYLAIAVGEQSVDSHLAGVLNATAPLWTIAIAHATRHENRLTTARTAGLLIGFAGTLLIFAPWQTTSVPHTWGALACLTAALSYGISYVYMDRFLARRGVPPLTLSAAQLLSATALLAAATPFTGLQPITPRPDALASLTLLGVLGTGAAYVLNYQLITHDGATAASTVTYLLPLVALALGAATLHEPLTTNTLAGVALTLAGVALTRWADPER
ncbi:MAG: DMT family transporter [Streptomycetales bacterium]